MTDTPTEVVFPARNKTAQALSRRWGMAYQKYWLVRFIDDFWYERDRIASTAVCLVGELGIDAIGLMVVPGVLPKVAVLAAGRLVGVSNEFHTLYLAVKHRKYALFNQPQTWVRNANGVISRAPGFVTEREELKQRRHLPLQKRFTLWASDFAKAYMTESRRMPSFVICVVGAAITYIFGNIFDLPIWLMLAGSWGPVVLPGIPEARNAIRALIKRDVDIFSKPQMQKARDFVGIRGRARELVGIDRIFPKPKIASRAHTRRSPTSHRVIRRARPQVTPDKQRSASAQPRFRRRGTDSRGLS